MKNPNTGYKKRSLPLTLSGTSVVVMTAVTPVSLASSDWFFTVPLPSSSNYLHQRKTSLR